MKLLSNFFIKLGTSLMLPIATLPVAGILLRIGQPDLLNIEFIAIAGNAVFSNLPMIFALGVAIGFAKDSNGVAPLAAFVGHSIFLATLQYLLPSVNMGVLSGIIIGAISGVLYNKYKDVVLPTYLAFFGGKRFIPIISGVSSLCLAYIFSYIWGPVGLVISSLGNWIISSGNIGIFMYGFANRMLIPVGLHHILNSLVWFEFGSFTTIQNGVESVVKGDLWRFFALDKTAGSYMSLFFPVMMFGLPGGALAMVLLAKSYKRKVISGILLSSALTGFLTGITEPIEFAFMFIAFPLYVVHAILTGVSGVIMNMLGVKLGFTFSAGAFDYILNYGLATNPMYLLPIGVIYFILYFVIFYCAIKWFNLQTPGREDDEIDSNNLTNSNLKDNELGLAFIKALGDKSNIVEISNCTTRLRIDIVNKDSIDEDLLKKLGAKGIIYNAQGKVQIVIGPEVEHVADKIKLALLKK